MRHFFAIFTVFILLVMSFGFSFAQDSEDSADLELQTETDVVSAKSKEAENTSQKETELIQREQNKEETVSDNFAATETPESNVMNIAQRISLSVAVIAGQILLIWIIWRIFMRIDTRIVNAGGEKIKPLTIKKLKVMTSKQIINVIRFFVRILKYIITVIQLFLTVPILFSLFPATRNIASQIFDHIFTPLKNIGLDIVGYIPNLFPIIFTIIITRYILRGLKFFADKIEKEKLVIPGFYPDWAAPTYRILQVLLWAFTVAIVYPYLPGSESRAFQGVSVFVGIIFSLGSSSAIGNLVAGLVITYMRPFKIGDRVQIKEITGFVVEKNMMVVRLKTHKNEYVTFPNLMILGSNIINYNTSSDEDEEGLIIYAEVTFGYSTPWQTVHDILINAALETDHVLKRPKPFVLQTMLDDFYARYQINCYTKEVSKIPSIYAKLFENIQNGFQEADIDMTAAHYRAIVKN